VPRVQIKYPAKISAAGPAAASATAILKSHKSLPRDFVHGRDAVERAGFDHSVLIHRACAHEPSGADIDGLIAQIN
jgi:hypothetical protein